MIDNLLLYWLRNAAPVELFTHDNPVFQAGFSHQQSTPQVEAVLGRTRRVITLVSVVTLVLWLVTILPSILNRNNSQALEPVAIIFGYLFMSFWVSIALDNDALTAAVESIPMWLRRQNRALLEAALFSTEDVIQAKYAIVQLHVWGRMVGVMTFRAVLIVLLLSDMIVYYLRFAPEEPVKRILEIMLVLVAGMAFTIEPLYRVKAMAAIGVIIHSGRNLFTGLQAWVVVIALWIVQSVLVILILGFISLVFRPLHGRFSIVSQVELMVDLLIVIVLFFNLYRWIGRRALEFAINGITGADTR